MFGIFMFLFVILCVFLAFFILIQPGKGDMGLGALGVSSQMLFGGSGGQNFFEKATWIMGALFMLGALGLSVLSSHERSSSSLQGFVVDKTASTTLPVQGAPIQQSKPLDASASAGQQTAPLSTPEHSHAN